MALTGTITLVTNGLWQQGDVRDPIGLWGCRGRTIGDATGGSTKVLIRALAAERAAYVYTCYSAQVSLVVGTVTGAPVKMRLLTNWPNVDPDPGVQAYSSMRPTTMAGSSSFTAPFTGPFDPLIQPNDRFLLLFDPRATGGDLDIIEFEVDQNVLNDQFSFEAYGYYWDRSVLQAPGGLRHPGSS